MSKLPAARAVTQGERELRDWHKRLRLGAAGAGFGMMIASLYQLHWAGTLVGFPTIAAGAMAVSLETLLAFNAGAVTTIRRRDADGNETGYYWSLWLIFGFLLTISIAANVGHAMAALATWFGSGQAPQVLNENRAWVYGIGSAVAAMVPLGGSFGLHISGFVRAHGAGSDWVDPDGTCVVQEEAATAPPAPAVGEDAAETAEPVVPETEEEGDTSKEDDESGPNEEDEQDDDSDATLTEEQLYAIWKDARDKNEESRFGRFGDLNPSQLGRRLGHTPQNGRKNVGPRFEARYRAEKLKEQGGGVNIDELAKVTEPSP
ncbi:hypothetical protein [Streptomyces sp. NRRL B-24572]|uniref:hypothetical protein n=1 Tax=Streptomyces sp. NRRL B-24572 TaxID=1962156 RepID=UPI00117FD81C|nr:hypothetical protein [Streptomyces sp. NRRL B-24572]